MKNKLTSGIDSVPCFMVKDCIGALMNPLLYLFNLILSNNTIPSMWKVARVCPILKKGDPSKLNNYRAISILSNFAKLLKLLSTMIFITQSKILFLQTSMDLWRTDLVLLI